jgi:hypothetical protein
MKVGVKPSRCDGRTTVHNLVDNVEHICPANVGNMPMPPSWRGVLID